MGDPAATSFIVAPVVPQVMAATTIRRSPIPRYTTARSDPMPPIAKKRGHARPLVGVIMGSRSDWETLTHAAATLEVLGVPYEVRIVSAHRTPDLLFEYAESAARRGLEVIIAAAGGAAHLPGMTAAKTPLPVLGVPVESRDAERAGFAALHRADAGGRPGGNARHRPGRRGQRRAAGGGHPGHEAPALPRGGRALPRPADARGARRPGSAPDSGASGRSAASVRVGVLGGGQLGRMLARAGDPLGIRCRFLDPSPEAPAGRAGELIVGGYDDPAALDRFADGLDARHLRVRERPRRRRRAPRGARPACSRRRRRSRSRRTGSTRSGSSSRSASRCRRGAPSGASPSSTAPSRTGVPAVLKTRRLGYDGKGQRVIQAPGDAERAWAQLGGAPLVLEGFVRFDRELSILAVRGRDGATACYPLVENLHAGGILAEPGARAGRPPALQARAEEHARRVLERSTTSACSPSSSSRSATGSSPTRWRRASTTPATGRSRARRRASSRTTCAPSRASRSATTAARA